MIIIIIIIIIIMIIIIIIIIILYSACNFYSRCSRPILLKGERKKANILVLVSVNSE